MTLGLSIFFSIGRSQLWHALSSEQALSESFSGVGTRCEGDFHVPHLEIVFFLGVCRVHFIICASAITVPWVLLDAVRRRYVVRPSRPCHAAWLGGRGEFSESPSRLDHCPIGRLRRLLLYVSETRSRDRSQGGADA